MKDTDGVDLHHPPPGLKYRSLDAPAIIANPGKVESGVQAGLVAQVFAGVFSALGALQPPSVPSASGSTSILGVTPWLHNQAFASLNRPAGQVSGPSTSKRFVCLFLCACVLICFASYFFGFANGCII